MTNERLQELKELYSKATPGEWVSMFPGNPDSGMEVRLENSRGLLIGYVKAAFHNAHVMVVAHNAFPKLLALAEEALRLREVVEAHKSNADALKHLVKIINSAGISNLAEGVQLGQMSWLMKANDAMEFAEGCIDTLAALVAGESEEKNNA